MKKLEKTITLIPIMGLCNRMRAIASAKALSDRIGSNLEIVWLNHFKFPAKFKDLFEDVDTIRIKDYWLNIPSLRRQQVINIARSAIYLKEYAKWRKYDLILPREQSKDGSFDDEESIYRIRGKKVLMVSYSRFYSDCSFSFFRPCSPMSDEINSQATRFNEHTAGVHVRRNDNERSKIYSPNEEFFRIIEDRIASNPNFNFFLATDSKETQSIFIKRYGDRVFARENKFDSYSNIGIKSALVDLFLLSRTTDIIGSYWSSFSRNASALGNIPFHTVYKEP